MEIVTVNFGAILLASFITGITSMVCDYTDFAAYSLADVTHMDQFASAMRSNDPGWYSDGMQLFAYSHNGREWDKRRLTWAIENASSSFVPWSRLSRAANRAFKQWTTETPFLFEQVSPVYKPDIRISFGIPKSGDLLCETVFPPPEESLDDAGVTIVVNDLIAYTFHTQTRDGGWYTLNYALLYEVSHCLGLGESTEDDAVMSNKSARIGLDTDYDLKPDDVIGIKRLYGWASPED